MVSGRPCEPARIPVAVTSLSTSRPGVDPARAAREPDQDQSPARLDEVQREGGQGGGVGGIDDGIPGQGGQAGARPRAGETEGPGELQAGPGVAQQVDLGPVGPREGGGEQPDRPGPEDQDPVTAARRGRPDGAQRVAARLRNRPGDVIDTRQAGRATRWRARASRSASATGRPPRTPISRRAVADVVAPGLAAAAVPAADHGVGGDAPARASPRACRRPRRSRFRTTRGPAAAGGSGRGPWRR